MNWAEDNGIDVYDPEHDSLHFKHFTSYAPNPRTWLTKEGVVLLIAQMSDSHLCNAIKVCLNNINSPTIY